MKLLILAICVLVLGGMGCGGKNILPVKVNISCEHPSLTKERLAIIQQDLKSKDFHPYKEPFKLDKEDDGTCFLVIGETESNFVEIE